jgi:hypothetical protein
MIQHGPASIFLLDYSINSYTMSEQFHGWGAFGADSIKGNFKEFDYTPKPFDDDDIESESLFLLPSPVLLPLGYTC